jgi:hypothetical protein
MSAFAQHAGVTQALRATRYALRAMHHAPRCCTCGCLTAPYTMRGAGGTVQRCCSVTAPPADMPQLFRSFRSIDRT